MQKDIAFPKVPPNMMIDSMTLYAVVDNSCFVLSCVVCESRYSEVVQFIIRFSMQYDVACE